MLLENMQNFFIEIEIKMEVKGEATLTANKTKDSNSLTISYWV